MAEMQDRVTAAIARRVKEARVRKGLSAEQLADRMREIGVPFDKTVVANLETGRRRFVTVTELLGLAYALSVAPIHLMVPIDEEGDLELVPGVAETAQAYRWWIRGQDVIGDVDVRLYASQVPTSEWGPDHNDRVTIAYAKADFARTDDIAKRWGARMISADEFESELDTLRAADREQPAPPKRGRPRGER